MSLRGWKFCFDLLRYVYGNLHPPPWKNSDKYHHHHHHHHHQPAVPFFGLVKYDHPAVPAGLVSNWNVASVVLPTLEIAIHQQKSGPNRIWLEQKRASILPRKLTWNQKLKVWKMMFLFKQVTFRFNGSFRKFI